MKKKKSKKPKKRVAIVTKKVTKFNGIKLVTIVLGITTAIWGVGGKMIYDSVQRLIEKQDQTTEKVVEIKTKIEADASFATGAEIRIGSLTRELDNAKKEINRLYRILNREEPFE